MKLTHSIIIMFISSFIIQYFLLPPIVVNKMEYITNNIGKAYLATIMALLMLLVEVMMYDRRYNVLSVNLYGILFAVLAIFICLYRKQIAVDDKQYLEGIIENHSMAIFQSEEILKKTDSYDIAKLAKNIIQRQNDEIQIMINLLKK
jgi:membrane protein required for beta-lactamase induction